MAHKLFVDFSGSGEFLGGVLLEEGKTGRVSGGASARMVKSFKEAEGWL